MASPRRALEAAGGRRTSAASPRLALALRRASAGMAGLAWAASVLVCPSIARADELLVGAAVSLREPLERIRRTLAERNPADEIRLSFGASSALAAQIRLGAPIDVFLSADSRLVDDLAARGLIAASQHFVFVSNRLVVVVAPSTPPISAPGELLDQRIRRFALPSAAVPLGHYAREWLDRHGLREALEARAVVTEHARATLAAVVQGHADAALVYATDILSEPGVVVGYTIPASEQPDIQYAAAALGTAGDSRLAQAFLDALQSAAGRRELSAAGFVAPAGEGRGVR